MSTASVSCTNCEKQFNVKTEYFQKFGSDPYCQDCLIHTECNSCNRGLRLQPSQYRELGGEPVICASCGQGASSTTTTESHSGGSFWSGLSLGEKIVFPLLSVAIVGLLAVVILIEGTGGEASAPILLPMIILLYWTYRRGKKNSTDD